jgi:predicted acetyltransferase
VDVELQPIAPGEKDVLRRLMQLYLHDFSEFLGDDVDARGEYHYAYFDNYFRPEERDSRHAFFIRADGQLAGFVLVRQRDGENSVAEFFVMRKYRRSAVGTVAARQVFARFPGDWKVAELAANLPAQAFWRKVIAGDTGGAYAEETDAQGVVQRFTLS